MTPPREGGGWFPYQETPRMKPSDASVTANGTETVKRVVRKAPPSGVSR